MRHSMRRKQPYTHHRCLILLSSCLTIPPTLGWGFLAHKEINEKAIFLLPPSLLSFYKEHRSFIREEAVKPDKRRYVVEGEAQCHYINIENYETKGPIPHHWKAAQQAYDDDFLHTYGTLPWHITLMKARLTRAFKEKNVARILRLSADIGHYIADAHVPLHTTENYDGQLTGQQGIHALWESRIPELFASEYNFLFEKKASYLPDIQTTLWEVIRDAHQKSKKVLALEQQLNDAFPSTQKYVFEQRGSSIRRTYTHAYAQRYHEALDGMVEQQLRASIHTVASVWLTCWIDAGSPDLTSLGATPPPPATEDGNLEVRLIQHIRPHEYTDETTS